MGIQVRRPETVILQLANGEWIEVKKFLTTGEDRRVMTRLVKESRAGERPTLDPEMIGLSTVLEYLVDWSAQDLDGKPIVVRDQSQAMRVAALNAVDPPFYKEVQKAIDAHVDAVEKERDAEKNVPAGAPVSSAT